MKTRKCTVRRRAERICKVFLKAGESREVRIDFDDKTFRYWNVRTNRWEIEGGTYCIMVGASCADIRLEAEADVEGTTEEFPYYTNLCRPTIPD